MLVAVFFGVSHYYPETFSSVKDFFTSGESQKTLKELGKEISNSGKLILSGAMSPQSHLTSAGTFSFTNVERTKAGLKVFSPSTKLNIVAQGRLNDMFTNQYFEHVSPTGGSASVEADKAHYEYISIGENIALGNFTDDAALVLAWMNSPGHRANILNSKFQELGVAVGRGMFEGKQTWIAVQIFGKPLSACPATDASLKAQIERDQSSLDANQELLTEKKQELDSMKNSSQVDRHEYNQKVDEYNTLVSETNDLIIKLKEEVTRYNVSVRAFNTCLDSAS